MKQKNIFNKGVINTDADERFVENGMLLDAENFLVTTSNGGNGGVGKNVFGNLKVTSNNFNQAKVVGVGKNESKNKCYYIVKAIDFDYLMEYDTVTEANKIVLQSSVNTRLNLKEFKRVLNIDIINDPESNGDLILFSGDNNPPRIGNIERMKLWGVDNFTQEEIMLIKAPPLYPPTLNPIISTENSESNYLENKFISFGYQYRYKDGYYSSISSWTKYFFVPKNYEIDFETLENVGMQNIYNAVELNFNTGVREVDAVRLVFSYSNSQDVYEIDTFIKSDEGWLNNETKKIEFNNAKSYKLLPKSEYFRSFDNVPETALAQTVIGSRVSFANYKEGKDLIDVLGNKCLIDFTVNLVANDFVNANIFFLNADKTYSFQSSNYVVNKGQILLNLTNFTLKKGNIITFKFNLKSINNPVFRGLNFISDFIFILDKDYLSVSDLVLNSTLNQQLQVLTQRLETNGGVVDLINLISPVIFLKGFEATNVGSILSVSFPVTKYEIDNTPNPNIFIYEYFFSNNFSATYNSTEVKTSLKSYRDYQFCVIYRDLQGRETTALTSEKNTFFIPNSNAITQNIANVNIPVLQKPPFWAHTYKFGIKRSLGNFEIIPINIFFRDGIFSYIKIDGENLNKLKVGDVLIVKRDFFGFKENVVKVKVLEFEQKSENFLTNNAPIIVEPFGKYAKIKVLNFQMDYAPNEFESYVRNQNTTENRPFARFLNVFQTNNVKNQYKAGSTIKLKFNSFYHNEAPYIIYEKTFTAKRTYSNFREWYQEEILPAGFISQTHPNKVYNVRLTDTSTGYDFIIEGTEAGSDNFFSPKAGFINANIDIRAIQNIYVFEKEAKELTNEFFYQTPEVFNIINGQHEFVDHLLTDTYNCFCQGNGVESFQIKDAFNEKELSIDFRPTLVSEDEYKQINRYADITYSGIYDSTTNINKLNEFNLSLANFKSDIEKKYGAIKKMRGNDTNLQIWQEDRASVVYYEKDLLTNADGTSNLTSVEYVLGRQDTYQGEYGISNNPSSFDYYGNDNYYTDTKRGVVIKLSNNGIFEISSQGKRAYFKTLFRNHKINFIKGVYDQHYDYYLLNIQYDDTEYVTWVYSDKDNGWLGKLKFNPEDMIHVNGELLTFKDGEVYKHNKEFKADGTGNCNTFYGIEYDSTFEFVFNEEPSTRKNFKTISIEGTDAWDVKLDSEINKGYIRKEDFEKQEGVFYAHVRISNDVLDTALLSCQGLGNCTVNGLVLDFGYELENFASIGDKVYNGQLLVGTITQKLNNFLTLDVVQNVVNGDFLICAKPQSVENNNLLGHIMKVKMTNKNINKTEVFAVNTETQKSYE